jgi:hypothetical protein
MLEDYPHVAAGLAEGFAASMENISAENISAMA